MDRRQGGHFPQPRHAGKQKIPARGSLRHGRRAKLLHRAGRR